MTSLLNLNNLVFIFYISMFAVAYADYCFFHFGLFTRRQEIQDKGDTSDKDIVNVELAENTKKKQLPVRYEDKYLETLRDRKKTKIATKCDIVHEKNKIIMEYTPLGNVAMWYDKVTESFHYNSDSTIPYRFLEVVARKYALQYNCEELYLDMAEEIKSVEEKLQQQRDKEKREKEEELRVEEERKNNPTITTATTEAAAAAPKPKSNVFAKFKDYNKTNTKTSVTVPSNKSGSTNTNTGTNKKGEQNMVILKENANRYTYDGRFSNFLPLVKIDRKLTNKRLAMTFADFKGRGAPPP